MFNGKVEEIIMIDTGLPVSSAFRPELRLGAYISDVGHDVTETVY